MAKIEKVLISVSDKSGVVDFARELSQFNVQFISTGGTAKNLRESGLKIMDVSDYTGFPEMMDGRVKTLHPRIHGGLLGLRSNSDHVKTMHQHNIEPIDMIVINLYPFEKTIASSGTTFHDAIENIDIGGPAMLRSGAKNFESVTVLTDPADYRQVLDEMKKNDGVVSAETNFRLAVKVYELTSRYDGMITGYLKKQGYTSN